MKIIQIATLPDAQVKGGFGSVNVYVAQVFALSDDGRIFKRYRTEEGWSDWKEWEKPD